MEKIRSEREAYHPLEAYARLVTRSASDYDLVDLLIDRARPLLPVRILKEGERTERIQRILSIYLYLYTRYKNILEQFNMKDVLNHDEDFLDVENICRRINDAKKREQIRRMLSHERDSLNAEFLDVLGFLPENVFSRRTHTGEDSTRQGSLLDLNASVDQEFHLLQELLPSWLQGHLDHPEAVVSTLSIEQLAHYAPYARLARWITEANRDFQECLREGFNYLTRLAPKGPAAQPFETVSDLGTKPFASLLGIVLNKKLPIRRRFEALRLLEWSIFFFSVKRNPVWQAQQAVRKSLHEILDIAVWDPDESLLSLSIDPHLQEIVERQERVHKEDAPNGQIKHTARRVRGEVSNILGMHVSAAATPETIDLLIFGSREKEVSSIITKVIGYDELARKIQAARAGMQTNITKRYAARKLADLRRRMDLRGKKTDLDVKPVGLDTLDDAVGFSLAINLQKSLDEYSEEERVEVNALFIQISAFLIQQFGLKRCRKENHLWGRNEANEKSHSQFRAYKVHGDYEIETEVFEDGRLVKKILSVPVEIQLMPVETHLRLFYEGQTGRTAYTQRKLEDLAKRLYPKSIGGKPVYPSINLEAFEASLIQAAE